MRAVLTPRIHCRKIVLRMKLFQQLKSVRLAVGLLLYLTVFGGLATLVPQGMDTPFYEGHYSRLLAALILQTRFDRFFSSIMFLLPALLFFVNLSLCTFDRFRRELRKRRAPRNFGPDILHLGLMILTIGAVVSFSGRQEGFVEMAVGDKVELPDGYLMTLKDFTYITYPDGRPKDWISRVDVSRNGETVREGYEIRVNNPLPVGGLKIYQVSHSAHIQAVLADREGKTFSLAQGQRLKLGDTTFFFMAVEGEGPAAKAVLHASSPAGTTVTRAGAGTRVGDAEVRDLRTIDITGLEAVSDPGNIPVFVSFVLIIFGLVLTFYRKMRDEL